MAMYVIYDRENGQIVHTHIQSGDLPLDREGLLALVQPAREHAKLATITVAPEEVKEGRVYKVDPASGRLLEVDNATGGGFGMGGVTRVSTDWPSGPFKITYSRVESSDERDRSR